MRKMLWLIPVVWAVVLLLTWESWEADFTLRWDAGVFNWQSAPQPPAQPKGVGIR